MLVQAEEAADGAQRYALLETVREYGRQKLLARGIAEATATRQRHAVYYSKLAERLCSATRVGSVFAEGSPAAAELRDRIDGVYGNLRSALRWWLDASQPIEGLRLAVTLCDFWMWCGMYHQARRWLERMLDLANHMPTSAGAAVDATSSVPVDIRTRALINLGVLGLWQGKYAQSCAVLQTAVALADQLGGTIVHAFALAVLGMSLWLAGDSERSLSVLNECLRVSLESGNRDRICHAYRHLGIIARWQGQYERAHELLEKSIAVALDETPHAGHSFVRSLSNLARVAYLQGNYDQAWSVLRQAFEVIRDSQLVGQSLTESLDWLAAVASARGDPARAARLFGAAEMQWQAGGSRRHAPDQPGYERDVASVRAQLEERAFAAAWTEGRAMNAQQAITYGLDETRADATSGL